MTEFKNGFLYNFGFGLLVAVALYLILVPLVGIDQNNQYARRDRIEACKPVFDPFTGSRHWPCADK